MSDLDAPAATPVAVDLPSARVPLLRVAGLTVEFSADRGPIVVVEDVSFTLARASTVGLVGESGSGKSVTARAILGLVGRNGRITGGDVYLEGRSLVGLSGRELRHVRGNEVSMIFQEPRRSLDPAFTVGDQIAEVARRHLRVSRRTARERAVEMLDRVHIPMASKRAHDYPHQLSGGMCQRVMLAMALAGRPKLLLADEPTTALDVTIQKGILELIQEIQHDLGLGVLFITHDLGVVAEICDRVLVMYAGQVVEAAPVRTIFRSPKHPYTQALLDSLPQVVARERLRQIPGAIPTPGNWPLGCRFAPRCAHAKPECVASPVTLDSPGGDDRSRCIRRDEIILGGIG